MEIQVINISFQEVFQRYSQKYNIFRNLYDNSLMALEIRELTNISAEELYKLVLNKKEICYKAPGSTGFSDVLILGSIILFKEIAKEISFNNEDIGFKVNAVLRNYVQYTEHSFNVAGREFPLSETYIMGIVNVTPDSFSDGGLYLNTDDAVNHALQLVDDGADFIDIGGESSRPGAEPVSVDVELKRVLPVIEKLIKTKNDLIISVDTTKAVVAEQALKCGAKIVNDISSFSFDSKIPEVVKKHNAAIILMHMKGDPKTMQDNPSYKDVVSEVYDYLHRKIVYAKKSGIKTIIADPGIGFGKRVIDNFELLERLDEFRGLGVPVMIGLSRKSFIGKALELKIDERDNASVIAEAISAYKGARIIRTHNVKNAVQAKYILKQFSASLN